MKTWLRGLTSISETYEHLARQVWIQHYGSMGRVRISQDDPAITMDQTKARQYRPVTMIRVHRNNTPKRGKK